jgi:hypothetical protein
MDRFLKLCAGDLLLGAGDNLEELDHEALLLVDVLEHDDVAYLEADLPGEFPPPFEE